LDIPKFIGENQVAIAALAAVVAAVATVAYAVLTYLLWADSSTFRSTANVAVYPAPPPFDRTSRYLAVVAENYGPAPALQFTVSYCLVGGHGESLAGKRTYREPVFGPGKTRRFMPGPDGAGKIETLSELADKNVVIRLEWQWQDRGGVFGRTRKHNQEATHPLTEIRDGLYGSPALSEERLLDVFSSMQDDMHELAGEVRSMREIMEEPRTQRQITDYLAKRAAEEVGQQTAAVKTPASRKRGQGKPA
jgi:hypothetical protein